jgi:hypothetical protein
MGERYVHSRSAHRDARVIEAYRQLQRETDDLFALLTGDSCHTGVRVAFTRCAQPYESDEELIRGVRADGTLEITSAVSAGERLHPLLDCGFGGAFDRFRAVHDLIGHAWCGYGFDLDEECAAWSVQDRLHTGLARSALATEIYGVNAARFILGEAPDLRAVLLLEPATLTFAARFEDLSAPNSPQRCPRDRAGALGWCGSRVQTGRRSPRLGPSWLIPGKGSALLPIAE